MKLLKPIRNIWDRIEIFYFNYIDDTWFGLFAFKVREFFKNWIWPGYYLKNFLFRRYDLVKMKSLKRYEYCDVEERLLQSSMELVVFFMEKEKPEEHVYWYQDEEGHDVGHKYGEGQEDSELLFPEKKGEFVMDIIKEIYNWWTKDRIALQHDYDVLIDFWFNYLIKFRNKPVDEKQEIFELVKEETKWTKEEIDKNAKKPVEWNVLEKYVEGGYEKILDERTVFDTMHKVEREIFNKNQHYLHLLVEVRPYLWT